MNAEMREVLHDATFRKWVGYYAYKLSRRYPELMDADDAKQELWEAVVVRFHKGTRGENLQDCARSAAYSKYGHVITAQSRRARMRGSEREEDHADALETASAEPLEFAVIEANDTLDRIDVIVRSERKSATREHQVVASWLALARRGYTHKQCAQTIGITPEHLRTARHRVLKPIAAKLSTGGNRS